jgi:hypothetical protein
VRISLAVPVLTVTIAGASLAYAARPDRPMRLAIAPRVRGDLMISSSPPPPRPALIAEIAATQRGVSRPDVDRALIALRPPLLACYSRTLATAPNASGLLLIRVSVDPSGDVSNAEVLSDYVHQNDLSACVTARLLGTTFSPWHARRAATITLRFRYSQQ